MLPKIPQENLSQDYLVQSYFERLQKLFEHDLSDVGDLVYIASKLANLEEEIKQLVLSDKQRLDIVSKIYEVRGRVLTPLQDLRQFAERLIGRYTVAVESEPPPKPVRPKKEKKVKEPEQGVYDPSEQPLPSSTEKMSVLLT